jgi:hypothetical protein
MKGKEKENKKESCFACKIMWAIVLFLALFWLAEKIFNLFR